jgi:hypothetical protein
MVWKGLDSAAMMYHCGKSIYSQGRLSGKLDIRIDTQVEMPGNGKWWLDRKMGSDKQYCQQCMCHMVTPKAAGSGKKMLSPKWIECDGEAIAVSLANAGVCLLSSPVHLSRIKVKGMQANLNGKALVLRNDFVSYTMADVLPLPDYKVVLPKG